MTTYLGSNIAGSNASLIVSTKAYSKPGPPLDLQIRKILPGAIALSWAEPSNKGGLAITDYRIFITSAEPLNPFCDTDGSDTCIDHTNIIYDFSGTLIQQT